MKKFKDFLYDKNDILIALLILVAAALIITWRMNAIMEYPSTLLNSGDNSDAPAAEDIDQDNPDQNGGGTVGADTGNDSDSTGGSSASDGGSDQDNAGGNAASGALWSNGALTRDVQVTVSGNSATEAIQCLVNAGLFDDYAEYQAQCDSAGLDHQRVSAGTFTFEAGATKADIARAVNWS